MPSQKQRLLAVFARRTMQWNRFAGYPLADSTTRAGPIDGKVLQIERGKDFRPRRRFLGDSR